MPSSLLVNCLLLSDPQRCEGRGGPEELLLHVDGRRPDGPWSSQIAVQARQARPGYRRLLRRDGDYVQQRGQPTGLRRRRGQALFARRECVALDLHVGLAQGDHKRHGRNPLRCCDLPVDLAELKFDRKAFGHNPILWPHELAALALVFCATPALPKHQRKR
eukprot:3402808-Prymnesium_polylepis.2